MNFSDKKVGETVTLGFDLARLLDEGETIQAATFTVAVQSGTDPSPSAMLSGTAAITGSRVRQKITGGVAGCYYTVQASLTTSAGNTYLERGLLPVIA